MSQRDHLVRCITTDGTVTAMAVDSTMTIQTMQRLHNMSAVGSAAGSQVFHIRAQQICQLDQIHNIGTGSIVLPFADSLPGDVQSPGNIQLRHIGCLAQFCNSFTN